MPPSKADYLAHVESIEAARRKSPEVVLGMLKTAAVSFEHLTNDPNWDRFLSYLQEKYEETKKERAAYLEGCAKATLDETIRGCQILYARADAKAELLEWVMGLPCQLMGAYQEVKS